MGLRQGGCFHQVGKVLEKMHKNDLKAWETSSGTEERYFGSPRGNEKRQRYHKLGRFKL